MRIVTSAGRGRRPVQAVMIVLAMLASAAAQVPPPDPTLPPALADYQDMMMQYEAVQAAAHRPGDESLSCEAIRTELEATVNDPAMQAYVNSSAEQAQRRVEQLNAVMPLLMRAQRLSELAALNACAWLSEGGYLLVPRGTT